MPPAGPPLPPGPPAQPTAVGLFFARTVKGDCAGAVRIAVWPLGLLFVVACAIGMWSNEDLDDLDVGWGTRMRVALAGLLQGVGGGFGVSADGSVPMGGERVVGGATLSWLPLLATAVWVGALVLAARRERVRLADVGTSAGFEAALRVGALCGLGGLVLGLYARPSYEGLELNTSPGLTLLGAFLLSTVVVGVVLGRGTVDAWLAARPGPGPRMALGALRTALLALVLVVALGSVVMLVVGLTTVDDLQGEDVLGLLLLLPNLGALALAMAWGAPIDVRWQASQLGGVRETFGYGELADVGGAWSVVGALAGGLVCALLLGVLAVRRSADRREQLLAAVFFVLSVLVLVPLAGLGVKAGFHQSTGVPDSGEFGTTAESYTLHGEFAAAGAELLLFALLWSFGAVLVVPFVRTLLGKSAVPGAGAPASGPWQAQPPTPAHAQPSPPDQPPGPAHSAAEEAVPLDSRTVNLSAEGGAPAAPGGAVPSPSRRRPGVTWAGLLLAAFLVGGSAAGGAFYLAGDNDDDMKPSAKGTVKEKKPARDHAASADPTDTPASPSTGPDPTASEAAQGGPGGSPELPGSGLLPDGFHLVKDSKGFSVGVMEGWQREPNGTQIDYAAPTGGDYLRIGIIENAGQSSYANFRTLEKGAKKRDDYQRLEMKKNTFRGQPGARWEFTYTSDDSGNTIHATDQAYVAEDGTEYSIYSEHRAFPGEESAGDPVFETALDTWSEPGAY